MKKLTLVEAFSAMRRWNNLSAEEQIALINPITKSYTVQIISTEADEIITLEFMLNNRFCIEDDCIGAWELSVASSSWFACIDPMSDVTDDVQDVKYIKDASHFKRFTSINAKLWRN